jgi:hypothetical protein
MHVWDTGEKCTQEATTGQRGGGVLRGAGGCRAETTGTRGRCVLAGHGGQSEVGEERGGGARD